MSSVRFIGDELLINTTTASDQHAPTIAALPDGGYVVTWWSDSGGSAYEIRGRVYDADGTAVGEDFVISTTTASEHRDPTIAALPGGGFVVAWWSYEGGSSSYDIRGRVYDAGGAAVGEDFIINTTTANYQFRPTIAALPGGGFVVTWNSIEDGSSTHDIRGRVYDASGTAVGEDFVVNTTTTSDQWEPTIAVLPDGRFVVTWHSYEDASNSWDIRGRVYDASGTAVGDDFVINTTTASNQYEPTVAALPDGRFVVTWQSYEDGGDIRGRVYDASGTGGRGLHHQYYHGK